MSSTPDSAESVQTTTVARARKTVALIGNPNTGKSTLFNALSGLKVRTGNYPGVTVEKKIGKVTWHEREIDLVDLPGTYSLSPRSLDELVSVDVLLGRQSGVSAVDAVVCIVDASNLERNLYLVSQVLDLGIPTVLVLNMIDVAKTRGVTVNAEELSKRLGIPVVVTEAHRRKNLDIVKQAISESVNQPLRVPENLFPEPFHAEVGQIREKVRELQDRDLPVFLAQRLLLDRGGQIEQELADHSDRGRQLLTELEAARERLAAQNCRVPAIEARVRYGWARELLDGVLTRPAERPASNSDRIDHFLTHRFFGLLVFAVLMLLVFQSIYAWALPLMNLIDSGQGAVAGVVTGLLDPGPLRSLIVDGVIAGVGGVLIFLPQICLLFLFIATLEDCGYMSRAAFLMDRLMSRLGLSGKSFVPLMSSFACAIPGVMATRVIENRRDRFVTILVAPLMSCSARLPVYLLLIAAFIPDEMLLDLGTVTLAGKPITFGLGLRAAVLFLMYCIGALVAIPVAWGLKKFFFPGETPHFVMELPSYKVPSVRVVFDRVYDRGKAFVVRAGTLIFATTIVIWALGYFPGDHGTQHDLQRSMTAAETLLEQNPKNPERLEITLSDLQAEHNKVSAELIENSFLGRMGHAIEPAVKPLGWDWRIGVGAIASFPAREVIISTLGTIYSLGGEIDVEVEIEEAEMSESGDKNAEQKKSGLIGSLQASRWPDGTKVFNVPVALSIMVFFALCAQCAATLMVIKRETNSWRWPIFSFVYMTVLAYMGALITYQVGSFWL